MSVVVRTQQVSKRFYLRHNYAGSLKERFLGWFHRDKREIVEEFWALRDVSIDIGSGESVGIIGSNGSGKSTLLKLIAGIHRPTTGRVLLAEGARVGTMIELGIGFHPELTGRENLALGAAVYGLSRDAIDSIADDVLAYSGLEQFIDQPFKNYSSGMQVRLGFSVAIHLNPEILLLDEIFAVGDADFQQRCLRTMRSLQSRGKTIVFVSHSAAAVHAICTRACLIDHGQLRYEGTVAGAFEAYYRSRHMPAIASVLDDRPLDPGAPQPAGWHREAVGGQWEAVGELQRAFLIGQGLRPEHYLLDLGCGALRLGVKMLPYLRQGHYYGVEKDRALLEAGIQQELIPHSFDPADAHFIVTDRFVLGEVPSFDVALAHDLFSWLTLNQILQAVASVMRVLRPGGSLFATYIERVGPPSTTGAVHPSGVTSYDDRPPFHYDFAVLKAAVSALGVRVERLGEWGHPQHQLMLRMTRDREI